MRSCTIMSLTLRPLVAHALSSFVYVRGASRLVCIDCSECAIVMNGPCLVVPIELETELRDGPPLLDQWLQTYFCGLLSDRYDEEDFEDREEDDREDDEEEADEGATQCFFR